MLKNSQLKKYLFGFSALLMVIGIVLLGAGITIGGDDFDYLRVEEKKWYQLISIDEDNVLSIGIHVGEFQITGGKIDLNNK